MITGRAISPKPLYNDFWDTLYLGHRNSKHLRIYWVWDFIHCIGTWKHTYTNHICIITLRTWVSPARLKSLGYQLTDFLTNRCCPVAVYINFLSNHGVLKDFWVSRLIQVFHLFRRHKLNHNQRK